VKVRGSCLILDLSRRDRYAEILCEICKKKDELIVTRRLFVIATQRTEQHLTDIKLEEEQG
jgi:hypothetical protein